MPLSADPPPRLKVGILWDADCIASNATADGRAQNRRVEVTLRPLPGAQY